MIFVIIGMKLRGLVYANSGEGVKGAISSMGTEAVRTKLIGFTSDSAFLALIVCFFALFRGHVYFVGFFH